MMRGYRTLKQAGETDLIFQVNQALTEKHLNLENKYFSRFMMGRGFNLSEVIVKQYLLFRIGGRALNSVLLRSKGKKNGKIVYPLPKKWREIISEHGFNIDHFRSAILWQCYILSLFLFGIWKIFEILFFSVFSVFFKSCNTSKYIYLANLNATNLITDQDGAKNYNILAWYLQWPNKVSKFKEIRHSALNVPNRNIGDIKLLYQKNILPDIPRLIPLAKYLICSLTTIFISLIDLMRGRWWHSLLLNQIALAKKVNALTPNLLSSEYLFHNSSWIYRPLWTYEAEHLGSIITFYFYSTNIQPFKQKSKASPINAYGYKIMSWSRYLVWDSYQAAYIKKIVGPKKIEIVGPIWFDSSATFSNIKKLKKVILIFDVQPMRNSIYMQLGLDSEYYTIQTSSKFLTDICQSFPADSFELLFKRKRKVGSNAHPSYRRLVRRLEIMQNLKLIDENIAAISLIEYADIVISMPFTSTALIARHIGKPTIFYDSTSQLIKGDPAAHGIEIISGDLELKSWASNNI